jgi:hypothetical protein
LRFASAVFLWKLCVGWKDAQRLIERWL